MVSVTQLYLLILLTIIFDIVYWIILLFTSSEFSNDTSRNSRQKNLAPELDDDSLTLRINDPDDDTDDDAPYQVNYSEILST